MNTTQIAPTTPTAVADDPSCAIPHSSSIDPTSTPSHPPEERDGVRRPNTTTDQNDGCIHPVNSERLKQKIDRLPKPTRDMINLMLDDGLPYRVIIDELAEKAQGLTSQSFTEWLKSGYEHYLKNREKIGDAKTQAEFAAD